MQAIKNYPHYGQLVRLWIFSPVKQKWINFGIDKTFPDKPILFTVDNPLFTRSLHWLSLGAIFFPANSDPNDGNPKPIFLPDEYLNDKGLRQDDLLQAWKEDKLKDLSMRDRQDYQVTKAREALELQKKRARIKDNDPLQKLAKSCQDWTEIKSINPVKYKLLSKQFQVEIDETQTKFKVVF